MNERFSYWSRWVQRCDLDGLGYPGVYVIAETNLKIAGTDFSWRPDIIYVGMTNSRSGLKSRLKQFDDTIRGGEGHGGGKRVRFKHEDYNRLAPRLYVSVYARVCNVKSNSPTDLRIMGDVAKHEYDCLALFVENFARLPEFNDKKRSPKK